MIHHATVLGAGVMGAQIAAHLANAGVPVLLLDLTPEVAREGFERAKRLKPDPFFTPDAHALVTTAGFDAGLPRASASDWIVEAVVERLDVKQQLFERLEPHRSVSAIVTSNTSGIPIGALAEGRSDAFRRHFLGTHFFNPPRYLRLLEVIPTPSTDPQIVEAIARFADRRLGKGVVVAKDTPNFIANHLGLFGVMRVFEALEAGFTIEEIDAISGPALGRPKSATFRTMDLAGRDVRQHVARNLGARGLREAPEGSADRRSATQRDREGSAGNARERAEGWGPASPRNAGAGAVPNPDAFRLPPFVEEMIKRGWVGDKAGQGFYKKIRQPDGGSEILTLDPSTLEYRPKQAARLAALDAARSIDAIGARTRALFLGKDRVGEFLRRTLGATIIYAAHVAPDIAHSIDDIDRAMRWGFAWDLGPFETWDAIGVRELLDACGVQDHPPLAKAVLEAGRNKFRDGLVPPAGPDLQILASARDRQRVVRKNAGASLVDLGDGVLCVEFHSKMNAIGGDTIEMLNAGVKEAARNFTALVVGNDAPNFSAGANLMLLLLEAQEGNWDEIDLMIRAFQKSTMGLRLSDVPVVVCPAGLTLGGGCEIALHGDRVQAAAESYIGLVEVGVGLIPAGGGTKEMLARSIEKAPANPADFTPFVQPVFETIGFAKVSTSGPEAMRIGYLRDGDAITMNRERLLADAKAVARARAAAGYRPPQPRQAIPVGGEGVLATLKLGAHLAWRAGRISDHDKLIGEKLAWILAGGNLPRPATVSEQHLLDLEREAFLSLCGQRKTQERIAHTLKTGKPLRN